MFLAVLSISIGTKVMAQCPDFTNLTGPNVKAYTGFTQRFSGWGAEGQYGNPFQTEGVVNGRHTIITTQAYDKNTDYLLPMLPPGVSKVIKLGNDDIGAEAEALRYRFTVDGGSPILMLNFAVVLQDPEHVPWSQPGFTTRVTDPTKTPDSQGSYPLVSSCGIYDVRANKTDPAYNWYQTKDPFYGIAWRPWSKTAIDLSSYAGKEVVVEFVTRDCDLTGHFGYAYFALSCESNRINIDCSQAASNGGRFTLSAPEGFMSYLWSDGQTGHTAEFKLSELVSPVITCEITTLTGCTFTLYTSVTNKVVAPLPDEINATICEGETYSNPAYDIYDYVPLQTGTNTSEWTVTDVLSCIKKVVRLNINVVERYNRMAQTLCMGQEFTQYAKFTKIPRYPNPGLYSDTVLVGTVGSCNKYDIMTLTVSGDLPPQITIDGDNSPCSGEEVTYSFSGAGSLAGVEWEWVLPSNVKLIRGNRTQSEQITVFFKDNTPGTITLIAKTGCGDIPFNLQVNPKQSYDIQLKEQVCQGDVFNKHGFDLGVQKNLGLFRYSKDLKTAQGCDSTITLTLNVIPLPVVEIVPKDTLLCIPGSEVTLWAVVDGMGGPGGGSTSSGECDGDYTSVQLSDLSSLPKIFIFDCDIEYEWAVSTAPGTIISTDPYLTVNPTQTTTYILTVTRGGCPVTAKQTVLVEQGFVAVVLNEAICEGDTYSNTTYGIIGKTTAGTYTNTFTQGECEVTVKVNLAVNPKKQTIFGPYNVCQGERYVGHGFDFTPVAAGMWESDPKYYYTSKGCDSTVVLRLNVMPAKYTTVKDTVCQFEPYTGKGFSLSEQNSSGMQTHRKNLSTSLGCDSVVTLELYVVPVSQPDFGAGTPAAGMIPLTNWSIVYDESDVAGWEWYLGSAGTPFATTKNASLPGTPGNSYTVTLVKLSKSGCDTKITHTVLYPVVTDLIEANNDRAITRPSISVPIEILAGGVKGKGKDIFNPVIPVTISIVGNPGNGTVSINNVTQTAIYTPNNGFEGVDVFEYKICYSGTSICDQAKVFVLVFEYERMTCDDVEIINFEGDHRWSDTEPIILSPCEKAGGVEINGVCWAKTNLGENGQFAASESANSALYQWGRKTDGHQVRTSTVYGTEGPLGGANLDLDGQIANGTAAYGLFIKNRYAAPNDWRTPQNNNLWNSGTESASVKNISADPCPADWRVPTQTELLKLTETAKVSKTWVTNYKGVTGLSGYTLSNVGGSPSGVLFLPITGWRHAHNGVLGEYIDNGYYWSSTATGTNAYFLNFNSSTFSVLSIKTDFQQYRVSGQAIRCVYIVPDEE